MDALVERGLAAVTFSLRGYGRSDAPDDPLTVDTDVAIEDLASVMDWLAAEGHPQPHICWAGPGAGASWPATANSTRTGWRAWCCSTRRWAEAT